MCVVACATILLLLINGKLKSICDFNNQYANLINLTDLYSPNNGAPYNQVF